VTRAKSARRTEWGTASGGSGSSPSPGEPGSPRLGPGKFFPEVFPERERLLASDSSDPPEADDPDYSPQPAEALNPAEFRTRLQLARAALENENLGEALFHLRLAESSAPIHGEVQYLLGLAHLQTGDFLAALDEFQSAQRVLPDHREIATALQEILDKLLPAETPRPALTPDEDDLAAVNQPSKAPRESTISRAWKMDGRAKDMAAASKASAPAGHDEGGIRRAVSRIWAKARAVLRGTA
jgi:tetratricopeptide (TPR) repeat protein